MAKTTKAAAKTTAAPATTETTAPTTESTGTAPAVDQVATGTEGTTTPETVTETKVEGTATGIADPEPTDGDESADDTSAEGNDTDTATEGDGATQPEPTETESDAAPNPETDTATDSEKSDTPTTAPTVEELQAMVPETFKPAESVMVAATRAFLDQYVYEMDTTRPSTVVTRTQLQLKLAKQLQRIMAVDDHLEFIPLMDLVFEYFSNPQYSAFQGVAAFREFQNVQLATHDRQWFSDVLNVLVTLAPKATRKEARATLDMQVSTRRFKDDNQRERFLQYCNRISGRS